MPEPRPPLSKCAPARGPTIVRRFGTTRADSPGDAVNIAQTSSVRTWITAATVLAATGAHADGGLALKLYSQVEPYHSKERYGEALEPCDKDGRRSYYRHQGHHTPSSLHAEVAPPDIFNHVSVVTPHTTLERRRTFHRGNAYHVRLLQRRRRILRATFRRTAAETQLPLMQNRDAIAQLFHVAEHVGAKK